MKPENADLEEFSISSIENELEGRVYPVRETGGIGRSKVQSKADRTFTSRLEEWYYLREVVEAGGVLDRGEQNPNCDAC